MDKSIDIKSLIEEGNAELGGGTAPPKSESTIDVKSLIEEGRSELGEPDLSKPEGTLSQMGKQFVAGVTTDLPKMAGEAVQAFTPEDWAVSKWGKEVAESAEAREAESAPDLRDKNFIQRAGILGARALAPSVAAGAGYAINPVVGTAGTVALFGGSQGQETYEKMLEKGASEEDARNAALTTGAIQGAGEAIANRLTAGVFGAGRKAAVEGVKGLIGRETSQEVLKPFARKMGEAMIGEPATEIAQDIGTQAVEESYGLAPEQSYLDTAAQSGTAALGMTALLAPLGLAGHFKNAKFAGYMDKQLSDPEAVPAQREAAVARLKTLADKEQLEGAEQWKAAADYAIENKLPIPRSLEEAQAITTPAEPVVEEAAASEPAPIAKEPTETWAAPEIDEATLDRVSKLLNNEGRRAAAGRPTDRVTPGMVQAAEAIGVPDVGRFTDPTELLAEIDAAYKTIVAESAVKAAKTTGQTVVDDLENIENKGPTVSAILNAKEAAAAAVDAQQAVNIPEQEETSATAASEEPIIPEQEQPARVELTDSFKQAVDSLSVGTLSSRLGRPDQYSPEQLEYIRAVRDAKRDALEAAYATEENEPGVDYAEQILEASEADGSRREQPEGGEENRDAAREGAGMVPGGQEYRNIPGIEEAQVEVRNGQSPNQAAQTTTSEVAEDLERTSEGFQKYVPVKTNTLREAADFSEKSKAARAESQTQEGDYQRGTVEIDGLTIAVENKKGTFRTGKDKDGKEWSQEMKSHYGEVFLRGEDGKPITGADGDLPDVFIAPGVTTLTDRPIFVIDQVDKDGNFDEHKVIMGPKNERAAAKAYNENYEKGWKGLGAITPMTLDEFKNWLQTEDVTKPVGNIEPAQPKKAPKKKYSPVVQEDDHLLEAIAKLGGLNRAEAKAQGVDPADFRKRGERIAYVFTSKGKPFDEMAEVLRGYGFDYSGPNDLLRDVSDSLQTKRKIYSTKGAEIQAEELVDDSQLQFGSDLAVLRDTAKWAEEVTGKKYAALMETYIANGDITPDTIARYQTGLQDVIAEAEPVEQKAEQIEEELLQPQYVPPTPAKQPVAQQGDIFATTKKERDELTARQGVADIAAKKEAKLTGEDRGGGELFPDLGQESIPMFSRPATRKQDDLAAIFSKLEYADAKADRDAILGDHPLKDQIDYIDQNFEKIFNALVKSDKNPEGKVERKCR